MKTHSRSKTAIFALIPSLLLILAVCLLELSLRLFRPDLGNPLTHPVDVNGTTWLQVNRSYLSKYFPGKTTFLPELRSSVFRKHKTANTIRIFCLGESTMFGVPYQMSATVPAFVYKQLRHLYPNHNIEVINAAASAINSNAILDLAKQFSSYEPDLFLLYVGHNEYYGPDGVGANKLARWFPGLIQFSYSLRTLYVTRLLEQFLHRHEQQHESSTMMEEVSKGAYVSEDSPDVRWVTENFKRNLQSLFSFCRQKNIPIIVSGLTSNLLFPPFASSDAGRPVIYDERSLQMASMFAHDSLEQAHTLLNAWQGLDGRDALVHFWLGKYSLAHGEVQEALKELETARDLDLLKFRAPTTTCDALSEVGAEFGIKLLPTDSLFRALSPNGITGKELFWEHLHPNARGYYQLANLYVQRIVSSGVLAPVCGTPSANLLPFDDDSLSIAWLDKAYADLSIRRLTSSWPFSNFTVPPEVLQAAPTELFNIAQAVYTQSVPWSEGCYSSAKFFRRIGDVKAAIRTYHALVDDYSENFYAWYLLGSAYKDLGGFSRATAALETSIEKNPEYPYPRIDLGLILINTGNFDSASVQLRRALRLLATSQHAERASVYYGIAGIAANQAKYDQAIAYLDRALAETPSYAAAQQLKAQLLKFLAAHKK